MLKGYIMNTQRSLCAIALVIAQQLVGATNPLVVNESQGSLATVSTNDYVAQIKILDEASSKRFFGNGEFVRLFARLNGLPTFNQDTYRTVKKLHAHFAPVVVTVKNNSPTSHLYLPVNGYVQGLEGARVFDEVIAEQYPALKRWALALSAATIGLGFYAYNKYCQRDAKIQTRVTQLAPGNRDTALKTPPFTATYCAQIASPFIAAVAAYNALRGSIKKAAAQSSAVIEFSNSTSAPTTPQIIYGPDGSGYYEVPKGSIFKGVFFVDRTLVGNGPFALTALQGQDLQATA